MAWTWRYEDADGAPVTPTDDGGTFPNRGDAETWLGEVYPGLFADGVARVVLLDDGAPVGAPIALRG